MNTLKAIPLAFGHMLDPSSRVSPRQTHTHTLRRTEKNADCLQVGSSTAACVRVRVRVRIGPVK